MIKLPDCILMTYSRSTVQIPVVNLLLYVE
jgi:hypothetical protein